MTYKDLKLQEIYMKGYYAGYRKATIDHLGGICNFRDICNHKCGSTDVQIDHIIPLDRKNRNLKDWKNLKELRLRCPQHHK